VTVGVMRGLHARESFVRVGLTLAFLVTVLLGSVLPGALLAAPYAAVVMDARDGRILYERNGTARLHPASLTKMLTLYIAFDAIERGEISLDTMVQVSRNAASEPPSRLGLKAGQKISMRHLIRAAALRSANDAATAIGEAISGSEERFAERMNRTAKAIGMTQSTFRNAHGLTRAGHLSTARDMTVLGRRLFYDFPGYYSLFSRRSEDAGIMKVTNTNRRLLEGYRGADGIKTGFTVAAGYNLTASAERGNRRIIATVFGGTSVAQRNAKIAELLDLGFREAPAQVAVQKPAPAALEQVAAATPAESPLAVARSLRPLARPNVAMAAAALPAEAAASIDSAIAEAVAAPVAPSVEEEAVATNVEALASASTDAAAASLVAAVIAPVDVAGVTPSDEGGLVAVPWPRRRPGEIVMTAGKSSSGEPPPAPAPSAEQSAVVLASAAAASVDVDAGMIDPVEVVTRVSTSGARHWGVTLGQFNTRDAAERTLLQVALAEPAALDGALRKVTSRGGRYEANFLGLGQDQADLACLRIQARAMSCFVMGP
jgi:D-alanyl-D-alanine carboxypeptidase